MAEYVCESCGMGEVGLKCAKSEKHMVHDHLSKEDGTKVAIAECPDGHGKIKSPMCCGNDMTCSI